MILCVATILGGIDLTAGSATPIEPMRSSQKLESAASRPTLETGTGLSLDFIYACAAIFVTLAFAAYLRPIYQEGVDWALPRRQDPEEDRSEKRLTLLSSILMNLIFDLIGPLLLLLIVIDLGGVKRA
ncbi:hypothetical protein [Yoonia sediminilitoris]|uniref:hypothetical protein n=1 Tax=Yoonia sediminilitoris TaxID=1286148 RepID=UPI0010572397|nr:hypothetical protein [Yoonia sediminilitoris]